MLAISTPPNQKKILALLTLPLLFTTEVSAGEELVMDEVTVVATGHKRAISETPYTVRFLDEDEIQLRLQPKSFADALDAVPGVMLQKTGHGMTSPYLRGVTSQRTVLMVDGFRLNNSFLREGPNQYWNTVDTFFFSNAEVLMGPASLLYGSDAIGGAVNALSTPLTRGKAGQGTQWQDGYGLLRWSSAEQSFSEHIEGEVSVSDRLGLRVGLTRQDFGELKTGSNEANPNTNYEQWGANISGRYWLDQDNSIYFGYDHFDQDDVNRVHRTVDHVDFRGTSTIGGTGDRARIYDHDRRAIFVRYEKRNGDSWLEELDLGFYYQYMKEKYSRLRSNGTDWDRYETRIGTVGMNLRLLTPSAWGAWTYGLDWSRDYADAWHDRTFPSAPTRHYDQGVIGDNARYDLIGIYLQNEYAFNSHWEMILGARYTYADMRIGEVNLGDNAYNGISGRITGDWDALTSSARLLFRPRGDNSLTTFVGVSQGFRAPNLSDVSRDDEFGGGTELPTANLDPEYFTTFEAGIKNSESWGSWDLTAYYTDIKDRIARLKNGGTATKRNLDDGYITGIDLDLTLKLNRDFSLFGSLSWQEGREESYRDREITNGKATRPIAKMMPVTGQAGIRYAPNHDQYWGEFYVDMAGSQDKLADAEKTDNRFPPGGTPHYTAYNLRGGYQISDQTALAVSLENITDLRYRIHGSGVNEPGRNLVVTLKRTF